MDRISIKDRIELVKNYYKHAESATNALRKSNVGRNYRKRPSTQAVSDLVAKFERTGSVLDERGHFSGRGRTSRTPEMIDEASKVHVITKGISVRKLALQLGTSKSTAHRIVRQDLGLYPYKVQIMQKVSEYDVERRLNFANTIVEMIDSSTLDINKILFSDEAHFTLDGYVNRQNYRIWGSKRPELAVCTPLHPKKVACWAGLCAKGIVGPIFLKEGEKIDGETYLRILNEAFSEASRRRMVEGYHFQQDGAPPHRTPRVLELIKSRFQDRVIALDFSKSTGSGIDWPPKSPDLSPLDFYLWGKVKDLVYRDRFERIEDPETKIRAVMNGIPRSELKAVIEHFEKRLRLIILREGKHIENIIN